MTRHESRAMAVCLMFEYSFGGNPDEIINNAVEYREEKISELSRELFLGAISKTTEIGELIKQSSQNWTTERIARLPLAVMRICIYELLYLELPDEICANEAVELCREFGGEEFVSFVNGIIGSIIKNRKI